MKIQQKIGGVMQCEFDVGENGESRIEMEGFRIEICLLLLYLIVFLMAWHKWRATKSLGFLKLDSPIDQPLLFLDTHKIGKERT